MSRPAEELFEWLSQQALPLWSTRGVDRCLGGFVEQMTPDGGLVSTIRRARLVARQIYAFRLAEELGWKGPGHELASHGFYELRTKHISDDFIAIPQYIPEEARKVYGFDLYDQAFVLFGLSQAARLSGGSDAEDTALQMLARMRSGWHHQLAGFGESSPITAPLKANPHMHLFEAAQSWLEASENPAWTELAREIADLCLSRFLDRETGALHELFDEQWNCLPDKSGHVIEPGHQAEWAWLLVRWYRRTGDARYLAAARRLFTISEEHGLHFTSGRLVNELDSALKMKDSRMRLWPQTERIKALVVFSEEAGSPDERQEIETRLGSAVQGLMDYFRHPIPGNWWEHIDDNDDAIPEPARASSLYHIMGAAAELSRHYGLRLT